ncbi:MULTISPECIES: hypothetical protein [unclassified Streptomyces]|uniref:hypothetical protein n=1 Tax=unclassified Streptomyces TaxID=2593676 RepID=UPI0023653524|nr:MULTISPECIES: hypothetical protein [unclassified Streptomyces]MDF3145941.1 hypothetical protein [Streptomyces sp. T21Q-yed]WDF42254.1 hypothetical protein PBV52_38395 [Streptomyces sp. T12]
MSEPSIDVVRAYAAAYRRSVAISSGTALSAEEVSLVGRHAARAAARKAIHEAVTGTWGRLTLVGALLVTVPAMWVSRISEDATFRMPFPFSWLHHHINSNDAPTPRSASFWIAYALVLLTIVAFFATSVPMSPLWPRGSRSVRAGRLILLHALALVVVTASALLFAVSGGVRGGEWPAARQILTRWSAISLYVLLLVFIIVLCFVLGLTVIPALVGWVVRPILRPYDLLLLAMIDACARVDTHRDTWWQRRSRAEVQSAIEGAARQAEKAVSAWLFTGGRQLARADARRVAAVIRQHRAPIARASGPASYDLVAQSLWSGVVALIDDDWEALTMAAPPVTTLSRLRRIVAVMWTPVVLLATAVALPWIPGLAQSSALVDGARVTLVITAVFGLVLPRDASGRTAALDTLKSLAFRIEK